ncbi:ArsR/SmtB family transcription factor [Streptomyces nigrescens]
MDSRHVRRFDFSRLLHPAGPRAALGRAVTALSAERRAPGAELLRDPVGVTLARSRMPAPTDPRRVRLCRLIARESMTTLDLAARLSMTAPQVSRLLRALRDLGLVRTERSGRFVRYRLDLAAVERLGQDVVTGLQH